MVHKASDRLRVLFGLPVVTLPQTDIAAVEPPSLSQLAETDEPEPTPERKVLYGAFNDIALRMAKASLLPVGSYDAAYDALEQWQGDKYLPSEEVASYLRTNWTGLLAIPLD